MIRVFFASIVVIFLIFNPNLAFGIDFFISQMEKKAQEGSYELVNLYISKRLTFEFRKKEISCENVDRLIILKIINGYNNELGLNLTSEDFDGLSKCIVGLDGSQFFIKDFLILDRFSDFAFYEEAKKLLAQVEGKVVPHSLNLVALNSIQLAKARLLKNQGRFEDARKTLSQLKTFPKETVMDKIFRLLQVAELAYLGKNKVLSKESIGKVKTLVSQLDGKPGLENFVRIYSIQSDRLNSEVNSREDYLKVDQNLRNSKHFNFGDIFASLELFLEALRLKDLDGVKVHSKRFKKIINDNNIKGQYLAIALELSKIGNKSANIAEAQVNFKRFVKTISKNTRKTIFVSRAITHFSEVGL